MLVYIYSTNKGGNYMGGNKRRPVQKNFSLDLSIVKKLENYSEKTGEPQSRILEEAIKKYIKEG